MGNAPVWIILAAAVAMAIAAAIDERKKGRPRCS